MDINELRILRGNLVRRLDRCIRAIPTGGFPDADGIENLEIEADCLAAVDTALCEVETALEID